MYEDNKTGGKTKKSWQRYWQWSK